MSSRIAAALLVLLVAVVPVSAVAVPLAADAGGAMQTTATPEPVAENTTFTLQLQPDGDARWTITDRYALTDRNETAAFEGLAQRFVDGESEIGWEQAFRAANDAASTATDRNMAIRDVEREYAIEDRYGTLTLSFTWTNFATTDDDRLVVRDAFNTTEGTWFRTLDADQTLVIVGPEGYDVTQSPTGINDGALRFEGPQTFEPGYLEVVYSSDETLLGLDDSALWIGGAVILLAGLAVAARYLDSETIGVPAGSGADDTAESEADDATEPEDDDTVDVTLLSDEERVEHLLEQNGGRMKQARIVKETGWSNAKVSQLLSAMDEDGRIDKLRIGRENLISFPDEDVTEIDE